MKKLLVSGSILALLAPTLAMASAGDVLLTTDVDLSVNSISLDITAATSTIESISVGSTSFSFALPSGSSIQITAPNLNTLTADNTLWQTASTTCTGSASILGYNNTSGSSITVTVIPSSTLCANAATATGSSRGDARGGGGGGAPVVVVPPVVTPTIMTPEARAAAISAVRSQIAVLIQKLIVLLTQQIQTMQTSGTY